MPIKIKTKYGAKDYYEVNERLQIFRDKYPYWSLVSEILPCDVKDRVIMKATIFNEVGRPIATGIAFEDKSASEVNSTSFIENCETSAWGRALANFGIGIVQSVASANEVAAAIQQQNTPKIETQTPETTPEPIAKNPPTILDTLVLSKSSIRAPQMTPKQSQIISVVATKYGEQCPEGFVVDTKHICNAILKNFGKYPSQIRSVEKILAVIPISEVIVKNDFIEGLQDGK